MCDQTISVPRPCFWRNFLSLSVYINIVVIAGLYMQQEPARVLVFFSFNNDSKFVLLLESRAEMLQSLPATVRSP
jgi:hypothetical protein